MVQGQRGKLTRNVMSFMVTPGSGEEYMASSALGRTATYGGATFLASEQAEKTITSMSKGMMRNSEYAKTIAEKLGRPIAMAATEEGTALLSKELLEKGFIETLGKKGAIKAGTQLGGRGALAVASQFGIAAIPGLNAALALDFAYQVGKLGGLAVKGSIGFGKDAMKSMQGNISGGLFGTYKDNEVAATSRARGVMAIQNSRLNARSLLGSEGAMMAAHFG